VISIGFPVGPTKLQQSQRFPDDYDGIMAGAAAFNRTHLHMAGLAVWQDTHASPGRLIQPGQMTLINQAVLKRCVGQDGGAGDDRRHQVRRRYAARGSR
jgi:feruloyl esterase